MPSGGTSRTRPPAPSARPPRPHARTSPGTSASGSTPCVRASQPTHSARKRHGRASSVTASGSRRPPSQPSSPPSTFAAAVAGYGAPAVQRLNRTIGRSAAAVSAPNAASRRAPSGRASARHGTSSTPPGRASAASAAQAAPQTSRSRAWARSAATTSSAASVTSMPESAPHAIGPVQRRPTAASRARGAGAPNAAAARRVRRAAPSAAATPSAFASASDGPRTAAPAASRSVQSGAVEPATGRPGLYAKPAPSARLRAKWRWIHESSSGNPTAPAICRSRSRKSASGASAAATTRRSSRRAGDTAAWRRLAGERVALVRDGAAPEREHVEVAPVRQLQLDEPGRRHGHGAPVVHEPDETRDARGQADPRVRHGGHRRDPPRGAGARHEPARRELVDLVLGQVEHRVPEPRVRAGVALLGEHHGLLRRVEAADRVDERAHDLLVLAERGGGAAQDPVGRVVLRPPHPGGPRRVEVPRPRARRDEERAVDEDDERDDGGGQRGARPRLGPGPRRAAERRHEHPREEDHERRQERQHVARLAEVDERVDGDRRERPAEEEPLAAAPAVPPDGPDGEEGRWA